MERAFPDSNEREGDLSLPTSERVVKPRVGADATGMLVASSAPAHPHAQPRAEPTTWIRS
jgi:hypothetical protein